MTILFTIMIAKICLFTIQKQKLLKNSKSIEDKKINKYVYKKYCNDLKCFVHFLKNNQKEKEGNKNNSNNKARGDREQEVEKKLYNSNTKVEIKRLKKMKIKRSKRDSKLFFI